MSFISAPSKIQAVIFPVKELAWRMDRCGTYCSPRAVVIILQASQRLGIWPFLAIFKFDFGAFPLPPDSKPLYSIKYKQGPTRDNFFDELDDFGTDSTTDELEEYLNTPTISTKGLEPLTWWYAIGESNPLARMAIDFLCAPGMPFIPFW